MRVRPAKQGAIIRDPKTKRPLPAEGGRVPRTLYWRRRLRAGDIELIEEDDLTPTGMEPVAPLTTRRPMPLPAPPQHAERRPGGKDDR